MNKPAEKASWFSNNAALNIVLFNTIIYLLVTFCTLANVLPMSKDKFEMPLPDSMQIHLHTWLALSNHIQVLMHRPWTIVSYMFTHTELLSLLSNSFWLLTFCSIAGKWLNNHRVIGIYLYGGFFSGLCFLMGEFFLKGNSFLSSSSTATFALAIAVTYHIPKRKIFSAINGGIPLWAFTSIYVILNFVTLKQTSFCIAYLGSGIIGLLFSSQLKQGKDWSIWMYNIYKKVIQKLEPKERQQIKF